MEFDWRTAADCRGLDPAIFFGAETETSGERALRERAAVAVCATCPSRLPCAAFALEERLTEGVWGGMAQHDLQRLVGDRHASGW